MIKERKIEKANKYLSSWDGATAAFNSFRDSMGNYLVIVLCREGGEPIGLRLTTCLYIQGPTCWEDVKLRCSAIFYDGDDCFEVTDEKSGFRVIVGSAISAGSDEFVVAVKD